VHGGGRDHLECDDRGGLSLWWAHGGHAGHADRTGSCQRWVHDDRASMQSDCDAHSGYVDRDDRAV
jgi:hypothetical protein